LLISDLLSMLLYRTTLNNVTIIFVSTSLFLNEQEGFAPLLKFIEQNENITNKRLEFLRKSLA
jgi:hypothetical protein